MIQKTLNNFLLKQIKLLSREYHFQFNENDINLKCSSDTQFGDYHSTIAFKIAGQIKKNPWEIAQLIKQKCETHRPSFLQKIEIVQPGYINFFIKKSFLFKTLTHLSKNNFKLTEHKKQKPIIVEYSSPNIAKPMHIGHLRSTIIGETLARVYEKLGYQIIRWNYIGDWGTQFGKLITAYKLWGNKKEVQKNPIESLLKLYQKFHRELKRKPELEKMAQDEFKKLEEGDKNNKKLWRWFKKESLKDFQKIYNLLGIKFDILKGESDFEKDIQPLIIKLKQKKLIQKSQGALIISLDQFNLPPALIQKSDQTSLYLTRDIATLIYRLAKYQPQKILYVVGGEQELYFQQLFAIIKMIFPKINTDLIHVKFGLVLNSNKKKFSTREGELILLEDVIEKAKKEALSIIKNKHPQWRDSKKEKTALKLALATLKFHDLKSYRTTNLVFDWKKMYDFRGDSAIYLLYTYARFNKILKKAPHVKNYNFKYLKLSLEIDLIKKILNFPDNLNATSQELAPNILASYLLDLANLLNTYYESVPVLKEPDYNCFKARLKLIEQINKVLEIGFNILGIETLEEI